MSEDKKEEKEKLTVQQACLHFKISEVMTFHMVRKHGDKNFVESTWLNLLYKERILEKPVDTK